MLTVQKRPFRLSPALAATLPTVETVGPGLAAGGYQFWDGSSARTIFDVATNEVETMIDATSNGRNATVQAGEGAPRYNGNNGAAPGQFTRSLTFDGDAVILLGTDFPAATSWTKVVAFKPDLVAQAADVGSVWRSSSGTNGSHRLDILNGVLRHDIYNSTGTRLRAQATVEDGVWTYAIAAYNESTKVAKLRVGKNAVVSATGTDQTVTFNSHFLGGSNAGSDFHGEIGPVFFLASDLFANATLLAEVTKYFEAGCGL